MEKIESTTEVKDYKALKREFFEISKKYKKDKKEYEKEIKEREKNISSLKERIEKIKQQEQELYKKLQTQSSTENEPPIVEKQPDNHREIEKTITKILTDLPKKERTALETEREASKPLPFETHKVKTETSVFIGNQIVKKFSGMKIPDSTLRIINKITKRLLIGIAVVSLWPSDTGGEYQIIPSNTQKNSITILKNDTLKQKTGTYTISNFTEQKTLNSLPSNLRNIYMYGSKNIKTGYIIVDKPSATMFIIGKNKELVASFPVLLGQTLGEEKNTADVDSDTATNATTPAGKYKLGKIGDVEKSDSIEYSGDMMKLIGSDDIAIHRTYPAEFAKRTAALNTPTIEDNRMSWGCINVSPENFRKYIRPNFNEKEDQYVFITPDKIKNSVFEYVLNPTTGGLEVEKSPTFVRNYGKDNLALNRIKKGNEKI